MLKSFIIIDFLRATDENLIAFDSFDGFICLGYCKTYDNALNCILEKKPQIVFFHFSQPVDLNFILDLQQYVIQLPYFVGINMNKENAFHAIKFGIQDYLLFPIDKNELRKTFLKILKLENKQVSSKLCIRSNGDYHFISFDEILYLKADNNTTDFYLQNGKIIAGFKTMKFYESQLPFFFFRIHNSYIVNIRFVSRINLSKSLCYILDNTYKIPFSRTYKTQIDAIISQLN